MPQQVGSFNYAMTFTITNLSGVTPIGDRTFRVIITRPDGSSFERDNRSDDLVVLDPAAQLLGVRIKEGDLNAHGGYQYQLWDETDGGSVRSEIKTFYVAESLTPPAP
jgi:hypothetical protein